MKFSFLPLCASAMFVFASCVKVEPEVPASNTGDGNELSFYTSEIDIKLTEEMAAEVASDFDAGKVYTKSMSFNELVDELGIKSIKRVFGDDERYLGRQHRAGLHLWYRVELDGSSSLPMTKAAGDLAAVSGISEAEPCRKIRLNDFNDPYFSRQWGFSQASGIDINVTDVWENYGCGSDNVIVAVVDEGVSTDHEDLPSVIASGSNGSRNFVTGSTRIVPGDHGYHVSGVIAASNNNGRGVCGIAGGDAAKGIPGAKILSCQIFMGEYGASESGDADAIRYAADNGAVICQNSWGYYYDTNDDGVVSGSELERAKNDKISGTMKAAIDYFIDYAGCDDDGNQLPDSPMKGGVVFFSAGNENIPYGVPASYERVIAVASIERSGARSSFSNYGDWVDICAPGSDITSTVVGGYGSMSGTSMACPHVSGAAALVLSIRGQYGFTNDMLVECLLNGANRDKVRATNIGPLLDVYGAVSYGYESEPKAIEQISAEAESNMINVSWTVPAKEDGVTAAYGAKVYVSKDKSALENLVPSNPGSGLTIVDAVTSGMKPGDVASATVQGLDFDTDYYVTVAPYNYGGHFGGFPAPVQVTTQSNNPPEIVPDKDVDNIALKASDVFDVTFSVSDPDGHSFTMEYEPGSGAEIYSQSGESSFLVHIQGSGADEGVYEGRLTVTDEYGASSTFVLKYEMLKNNPPQILEKIGDRLFYAGAQADLAMSEYFTDPDGDALVYSTSSSSPSSLHVTSDKTNVYLVALNPGTSVVTVTAKDPRNASAEQSFRVVVRREGEKVDLYPTQVSDSFTVGTGEELENVNIRIISSVTGQTVYDKTVEASAFGPVQVDASGIAPGEYAVNIEFGSESVVKRIVKL